VKKVKQKRKYQRSKQGDLKKKKNNYVERKDAKKELAKQEVVM